MAKRQHQDSGQEKAVMAAEPDITKLSAGVFAYKKPVLDLEIGDMIVIESQRGTRKGYKVRTMEWSRKRLRVVVNGSWVYDRIGTALVADV